jgi:hypothetical protein
MWQKTNLFFFCLQYFLIFTFLLLELFLDELAMVLRYPDAPTRTCFGDFLVGYS